MAKKRELLRIGFDSGASAIKCHASCGDRATSLVLSPGAIQQRSETLDAYRCQVGTDLIHRSFAGVGENYLARLKRKTLCYFKSAQMLEHSIILLIHYLKFNDLPLPYSIKRSDLRD